MSGKYFEANTKGLQFSILSYKRLEAEKEILNRVIDIADDMFNTETGKKYFVGTIAITLGYSRQNIYKQQQGFVRKTLGVCNIKTGRHKNAMHLC